MSARRLSLLALLALVATVVLACAGASPAAGPLNDVGNRVGQPVDGEGFVEADGNPQDDGQQAPADERLLIVYSGTLQLEVSDIDAAVSQAQQLITSLGGHVAASRSSDTEDGKSAYVTYRIPAERWNDALNGIKALAARVVDESTGSEDVTAQVVDLEARLDNLRTTETALQAIMDRATSITDVLKVQGELTQVRGDIERLTAERDLLANRAALATLEVAYNVPLAAVTRASEAWDPGREVDSALAALVRVGQGAISLAIWLAIVIVPIFAPILIVIYGAYWLRRRWVRGHPPTAG